MNRAHSRRRLPLPALFLALAASLAVGCAELDPALIESVLEAAAGSREELDEPTVARGLREALAIGTARAVERTSRIDGFLANELIRISLPEEFDTRPEPCARSACRARSTSSRWR